ncbi:MAG: polysaccharide pyruvyl transferase family protein [Oscillospiraceae bacterium]|nr:polysaccharide pyruvyl transferase family protein [Oscillospiraceae bacterium]
MKKACISTYCNWNSYGSILQALGLKLTLRQLGIESFVVEDTPAPCTTKIFPLAVGRNPKMIIRNFVHNRKRDQKRKHYENTVRFINENLDIEYYNDYESVKKSPPVADYYIAGSDQIWHPELCKPLFFLDFLSQRHQRLSYAASMGVTDVPPEREEIFARMISQFTTHSVRENEVKTVVEKYTTNNVQTHIDPTFLQSADTWRQYGRPYPVTKPYILVYAIYWDKALNQKLKELHKKTGFDIIALGIGFPVVWSTKWILDADPAQFLWLIDHAEAVVSSSFHGIAFSLIFNKKLSAVINPQSPSRVDNILSLLDYKNVAVDDVLSQNTSQYTIINQCVAEQKQKSLQYLKEILQIYE